MGSFSSREETFTGLEVRLVVGSWVSVSEWSPLGCKNPSSKHVIGPSALHIGVDSLRDTHRGSSGTVTWSFSQVMMGAGSPSVWHSKRAVPFSSTVWDLGCREKSASAGDEHSEESVRERCQHSHTEHGVTETQPSKPRTRVAQFGEQSVAAKG